MAGIIVDKKTRFLKLYYKIFFPTDEIVKWLTYGDETQLKFREFAYTTANGSFKRYISFTNSEDMTKLFYEEAPIKVDVSAVYNVRPKYNTRMKLKPIWKELIFDIDLTDYDDLRICCTGVNICEKCWNYIVIACKILDASFKEDWGFQHILWVFSGRRGIHIWVCDEKVHKLNTKQRAGIVEFFQLVKGNMFGKTRVHLKKMHVSIRRALNIIQPYFIPIIVIEQDMLGNKQRMDNFLELLPDKNTKHEVNELFNKYSTSIERWEAFLNYIKEQRELKNKVWLERHFFVQEIILRYCYPRLDSVVTTGINHLLKLPFTVHPETGKIAILLNIEKIHSFNPNTSPTTQSLWNEKMTFNSINKTENEMLNVMKNMKEYEKTSLKESVDILKNFLINLENNYSLR